MSNLSRWTDDERATLRACYAPNAGGLAEAIAKLPHRTPSAISFQVSAMKLGRRYNRRALMWTPSDDARLREAWSDGGFGRAKSEFPDRSASSIYRRCQEIGVPTSRRPRADGKPVAVRPMSRPKPVIRDGECDRGDHEHIRRRIPYLVDQLAREISRTPAATLRALIILAARRFEPDALAKLTVNREEAAEHALGSHVGTSYRFPSNRTKTTTKGAAL